MQDQSNIYSIFQLTEIGFKFISISIMIIVVIGIVALIIFFRDMTGKKIMFFGGELIVLGFILNAVVDFKVRYPSLSFIVILLGTIISVIGLLKNDK